MSKKTALILTGGTIGSCTQSRTISLSQSGSLPLLERYKTLYPNDQTTFAVFTPIRILSENITEDTLHTLMQCISELDTNAYNGILIAHGSDTIHFTAAMAALLFHHTPIPIIFTCAATPPDDPDSNAFINLHLAIQAIQQQIIGVWLAYRNRNGSAVLIDAARIAPCTQSAEFYDYYAVPAYRQDHHGKFIINTKYKNVCVFNTPYTLPAAFQKVLFISPYSLMDYDGYCLSGFDCVLHGGYHSATACCKGTNTSILPFIAKCAKENKPFYFVMPDALQKPYCTTAQIIAESVIPIRGFTPYTAYAHVLLQNKRRL